MRAKLASLDEPDTVGGAAADATKAWRDAVATGDIPAQRALIRRAFPRLTLAMPRRYGDHSPERFIWDGTVVGSTRNPRRGSVDSGVDSRVATAPDGWPLWTSPVRPGREHDTTCARAHDDLLDVLADWTDDGHAVLADLGLRRREQPD